MDLVQLLDLVVHFDRHLGTAIAQYGTIVYLVLFTIVLCEIAFLPLFFLPGDPLLFVTGAFCATSAIDIRVVVPLLVVATVAGSVVNYAIGHAIGQKVYTRDYPFLDRAALARTHAFYEQHGAATFLLSPFIAVVRTFAPFVAGVVRMTFAKFVLSVVAGALVWVISLVVGGYLFGNVPLVRDHLGAILSVGIVIGAAALVAGAWRVLRSRSAR